MTAREFRLQPQVPEPQTRRWSKLFSWAVCVVQSPHTHTHRPARVRSVCLPGQQPKLHLLMRASYWRRRVRAESGGGGSTDGRQQRRQARRGGRRCSHDRQILPLPIRLSKDAAACAPTGQQTAAPRWPRRHRRPSPVLSRPPPSSRCFCRFPGLAWLDAAAGRRVVVVAAVSCRRWIGNAESWARNASRRARGSDTSVICERRRSSPSQRKRISEPSKVLAH